MATITLWAINEIGIGHTVRCSLIARALREQGHTICFVVEHTSQIHILRSQCQFDFTVYVAGRPWRPDVPDRQDYAKTLAFVFRRSDLVIADLGTIPSAVDFGFLAHSGVPIVFLFRWFSYSRWLKLRSRIMDYGHHVKVLFVMPKHFFSQFSGVSISEINLYSDRLLFAEGFVCRPLGNVHSPRKNIAFTCGLGGVHSAHGQQQLNVALEGVIEVIQGHPDINADAWVGANTELLTNALTSNAFSNVFDFHPVQPAWDCYHCIVTRCSFNTFLEVMQSRALVVTAPFESSDEWSISNLRYLEQFGVDVLRDFDIRRIVQSIERSLAMNIDNTTLGRRRDTFTNATRQCASLITSLLTDR